jgi:hypothetical protein
MTTTARRELRIVATARLVRALVDVASQALRAGRPNPNLSTATTTTSGDAETRHRNETPPHWQAFLQPQEPPG